MTVRLRDLSGGAAPSAALVRLFTGLTAARRSGPLEEAEGPPLPLGSGAARADVPAAGTATMVLTPDRVPPGGDAAAAGDAAVPPEPAQPVFTRYWPVSYTHLTLPTTERV